MAQRSHVPKFGNWESEENVPYTAYFDKARKGRGGPMINPNDPQENLDLVPEYAAPPQGPHSGGRVASEEPVGQGAVRRAHERQRSSEESDLRRSSDSPGRHDNMNRRAANEPVPQRYGGRGVNNQTGRQNVRSSGSEYSIEQSPIHQKAKISGRGSGAPSPAWEAKGSYESSHGTPGRSRLKPKGDESPDKGAAVPKFGEWDENNPASADGYTHIFNKVREERQTGAGKVPGMPTESPYRPGHRPTPSNSSKSCCFPWGRK
ncbi:RPM1-interacting protein 4 [Mercurialis annua]|uniref:RPM1-interacting protein 4 n=1 Tax=Mercurialis annua TaxID=3986 RepID=UPI0021607018|nr:RPM1-interacting protein 4 [Mercurialis annua]